MDLDEPLVAFTREEWQRYHRSEPERPPWEAPEYRMRRNGRRYPTTYAGRDQRMEAAARLWAEHMSIRSIAWTLGVSANTVKRDLAEVPCPGWVMKGNRPWPAKLPMPDPAAAVAPVGTAERVDTFTSPVPAHPDGADHRVNRAGHLVVRHA